MSASSLLSFVVRGRNASIFSFSFFFSISAMGHSSACGKVELRCGGYGERGEPRARILLAPLLLGKRDRPRKLWSPKVYLRFAARRGPPETGGRKSAGTGRMGEFLGSGAARHDGAAGQGAASSVRRMAARRRRARDGNLAAPCCRIGGARKRDDGELPRRAAISGGRRRARRPPRSRPRRRGAGRAASPGAERRWRARSPRRRGPQPRRRSEEHTSELQ